MMSAIKEEEESKLYGDSSFIDNINDSRNSYPIIS
jgi:hypothetical protein